MYIQSKSHAAEHISNNFSQIHKIFHGTTISKACFQKFWSMKINDSWNLNFLCSLAESQIICDSSSLITQRQIKLWRSEWKLNLGRFFLLFKKKMEGIVSYRHLSNCLGTHKSTSDVSKNLKDNGRSLKIRFFCALRGRDFMTNADR